MSVPRVLMVPTHRTGVADALAAVLTDILTAQGRQVRYHHVGPQAPMSAWDSGEGAVFIDPGLTGEDEALGLYEIAVRHADVSLLSSTGGLLDHAAGTEWTPLDVAELLDCPIVVVMDCKGWGSGIEVLATGIKAHLKSADLAGTILTGVSDQEHCALLKRVLAEKGIKVVGCLYMGQGLDWESSPPGAWGLPLPIELLDAVARQVDIKGLLTLASQRGFLATHKRLSDHGGEGPLVMVAGGEGFTQWSRDSVEVLRSAGAQVRRIDLLEDEPLPPETAGLVIAGTLWPDRIQDISLSTTLLRHVSETVGAGLPTLAMGGGMLIMLAGLQDTLGRTSEMAGVIPAQGEILWDLEEPAYVQVTTLRDNVLLSRGDKAMGWALTEVDLIGSGKGWDPPLTLRGAGGGRERQETYGGGSLLCSPVLIHLSAVKGAADRFVEKCQEFALSHPV